MFGFGEVMARSTWVTAWLAGSSGFCLSVVTLGFFFFFFLIWVFVLVGFWWVVGSGGHGGGVVVVTGQWRCGDRG